LHRIRSRGGRSLEDLLEVANRRLEIMGCEQKEPLRGTPIYFEEGYKPAPP
jgi:hypothetical protein